MTETSLQHPAAGKPDAEYFPLTGLADGLRGLAAALARLDALTSDSPLKRRRSTPTQAKATGPTASAIDALQPPNEPPSAAAAADDFSIQTTTHVEDSRPPVESSAATTDETSSRTAAAASSQGAGDTGRQQLELLREIARHAAEMKISLRRLEGRDSIALFAPPAIEL